MGGSVKARIIRIGNSQGIRIPKPILEQTGLSDDVELDVVGNQIIIRSARQPRSGWDAAFATMAATGDDTLLDAGAAGSAWDDEEWTW
jgi:antitoxin MazE